MVISTVDRAGRLEMGMEVSGSGGQLEPSQGSHGLENTAVCKRTTLLLAQLIKAGIKRQLECVKQIGREWKSEPVLSTMATGGLVRRLEEMKSRCRWEEAEVGRWKMIHIQLPSSRPAKEGSMGEHQRQSDGNSSSFLVSHTICCSAHLTILHLTSSAFYNSTKFSFNPYALCR